MSHPSPDPNYRPKVGLSRLWRRQVPVEVFVIGWALILIGIGGLIAGMLQIAKAAGL